LEQRAFNDVSFQQYLNEKRLMAARCTNCGALFFPPRGYCIGCSSFQMEWVELKGSGKISAFTCIAVGPPAMMEQGYDRKNPYCTGVVDLDEGPRTAARIEGVDAGNPAEIHLGMSVTATFIQPRNDPDANVVLGFTVNES
jgi:uncharacterized protein